MRWWRAPVATEFAVLVPMDERTASTRAGCSRRSRAARRPAGAEPRHHRQHRHRHQPGPAPRLRRTALAGRRRLLHREGIGRQPPVRRDLQPRRRHPRPHARHALCDRGARRWTSAVSNCGASRSSTSARRARARAFRDPGALAGRGWPVARAGGDDRRRGALPHRPAPRPPRGGCHPDLAGTPPDQASAVELCSINIGGTTLVDEDFGDYLAARLRRSPLHPEPTLPGDHRDQRGPRHDPRTPLHRPAACARMPFRPRRLRYRVLLVGYLRDLDVDFLGSTAASCATWRTAACRAVVRRSPRSRTCSASRRWRSRWRPRSNRVAAADRRGLRAGLRVPTPRPIDAFFGLDATGEA